MEPGGADGDAIYPSVTSAHGNMHSNLFGSATLVNNVRSQSYGERRQEKNSSALSTGDVRHEKFNPANQQGNNTTYSF